MKLIKFTTMVSLIVFISLTYSTAQGFTNLSDCLVTTDIGKYIYDVKIARLGNAAGVVGGADHFKIDHVDSICSGEYSNINEVRVFQTREEIVNNLVSVDVQVTQHTGGDSDRWLLHEIEDSYRDPDNEDARLGLLLQATRLREINGNKIIGRRGNGYTWVSNNVVVDVSYTDLQGNKPEPLEVVQAYLAKFPSSITTTPVEFKGNAYNAKWIKDEIDRRLWLCDKWNAQFQAGGVTQADLIYNLVRSMKVFLNYRQKYFGVAVDADLKLLAGYQQNKDIAAIQTKLSQYKGWWSSNKARSISLP